MLCFHFEKLIFHLFSEQGITFWEVAKKKGYAETDQYDFGKCKVPTHFCRKVEFAWFHWFFHFLVFYFPAWFLKIGENAGYWVSALGIILKSLILTVFKNWKCLYFVISIMDVKGYPYGYHNLRSLNLSSITS